MTPRRTSPFGPLVWWELARLARGGHVTRSRVLFLYALLLTIIVFVFVRSYPASPLPYLLGHAEFPASRAADLWRVLTLVLFQVQLLLVAVFTPALATAALSEEKDRRTLPLLLTTALSDREIVWGKALARVLFVLAAVATGLPVFLFLFVHSGVPRELIIAGYTLTAGTATLSTAIGIVAACQSADTRSALVRAYGLSALLVFGLLIPPLVFVSPFAMFAYISTASDASMRWAIAFGYPLIQAMLAGGLLVRATHALRCPGATAGPHAPTAFPEPPRGRPVPVIFAPAIAELPPLPPVSDAAPVLWKERHASRLAYPMPARMVWGLGTAMACVALLLFVAGGWLLLERAVQALDPDEAERLLNRSTGRPDRASTLLRTAGVLASALYLLPLAVGVTGCVAGERLRGTLDSLLCTPLRRGQILRSKVQAHTERGLVFAGGAIAAFSAGFGIENGLHAGLQAVAVFAAGVVLIVGLGSWLTVRCATPVRAFRLCLPAVVAVVAVPVLTTQLLAWATALAIAGALLWWRAGVELERG